MQVEISGACTIQMEEKTNSYILVWIPEEERPLGKLRYRWKNAI
jgi:hypothetical protein